MTSRLRASRIIPNRCELKNLKPKTRQRIRVSCEQFIVVRIILIQLSYIIVRYESPKILVFCFLCPSRIQADITSRGKQSRIILESSHSHQESHYQLQRDHNYFVTFFPNLPSIVLFRYIASKTRQDFFQIVIRRHFQRMPTS